MFSGEKILENAKIFTSNYLREKRAQNQLLDKWIITKDLPGEVGTGNWTYISIYFVTIVCFDILQHYILQVGYALDVPWYASLPRLETRFFLEHYGGEDDVWIGKTLYRYFHW